LSTFAEWVDQKPVLLEKPHIDLTNDQRREVDQWVSEQFRRKNFCLISSQNRLLACDRTPLDPLVFAAQKDVPQRAKAHHDVLQPNSEGERIIPGHIVLLTASAEELMARAKERHKGATLD
jgi:hypothetical protein